MKISARMRIEQTLKDKYVNKHVTFTYPGYDRVVGKVDEIAVDVEKGETMAIIQLNDKRYTCSLIELNNCLKLIKNES